MLKTSELRIGNRLRPRRILNPEKMPLMGLRICAAHIAYSEEELNHDWEGIPITVERLRAFGFEWIGDYLCYNGFRLSLGFARHDPDEQFLQVDSPFGSTIIHFVHQLQNWFFALTGQELPQKEKI